MCTYIWLIKKSHIFLKDLPKQKVSAFFLLIFFFYFKSLHKFEYFFLSRILNWLKSTNRKILFILTKFIYFYYYLFEQRYFHVYQKANCSWNYGSSFFRLGVRVCGVSVCFVQNVLCVDEVVVCCVRSIHVINKTCIH